MYACLAVTCHLHFWQNDPDFLRATVVTRGWNGYRNKSQHRKSTLEKKILPPFQQGFEPATFQSRVRCSNHWAIPAPCMPPPTYPVFIPHSPLNGGLTTAPIARQGPGLSTPRLVPLPADPATVTWRYKSGLTHYAVITTQTCTHVAPSTVTHLAHSNVAAHVWPDCSRLH